MNWFIQLLGKIIAPLLTIFTARQWGKAAQENKQTRANNKVLKRYEEINTRPKLSRPDLYKRLHRKK